MEVRVPHRTVITMFGRIVLRVMTTLLSVARTLEGSGAVGLASRPDVPHPPKMTQPAKAGFADYTGTAPVGPRRATSRGMRSGHLLPPGGLGELLARLLHGPHRIRGDLIDDGVLPVDQPHLDLHVGQHPSLATQIGLDNTADLTGKL